MFNCFKKDKVIVSEGYGEKADYELKFGLVIPHTKRSPGASGYNKRTNEYDYGLDMLAELDVPGATRDEDGISGAIKTLKLKGCNASLEPHYNAYNRKAYGSEILVLEGDNRSADIAYMMMEDFHLLYPKKRLRHDKGIKWVKRSKDNKSGDRGSWNLYVAKKNGMKVALLSELFFGDNESDWMSPPEQASFWKRHI